MDVETLTGKDLIALGYKPGKHFYQMMRNMEIPFIVLWSDRKRHLNIFYLLMSK